METKDIVKVLTTLSDAGHEIVACDFRTGEVTFRCASPAGPDTREGQVVEILRYAAAGPLSGSKIPAIKLHRSLYGSGLAVAKAAVEALIMRHGLGYRDAAGIPQLGNLVPVEPWAPEDADDRVPEDRIDF